MLTANNCDGAELPKQNPPLENSFIIYPFENIPETLENHEFIGISPDELSLLVQKKWKKLLHKMVVFQPVTFQTKKEYNLHRILRAIDNNTLLSKLEEKDVCAKSEFLKPTFQLLKHFKNYPQIIENTEKIIHESHFEFDFSTPKIKNALPKVKNRTENCSGNSLWKA